MLFEMLAREKPYVSDNPMAIIYKHRKAPIPSLPDAVAVFQPLVEKLLAKSPDDRFATAVAAAEAIRAAAREHLSEELAA
jgi:hypothetical protein